MRVGMTVVCQNPHDGEADHTVYADELRLADLAEPLGFDSIWGVEHHFTNYTMCPDVLEFLTYMAGRTRRVQLGSMVVVLPWHDPIRLAEEISVLVNLSVGRLIFRNCLRSRRMEFYGVLAGMGELLVGFLESTSALPNRLD